MEQMRGRGKSAEGLDQLRLIQRFAPQKLDILNRRVLGNSLPQAAETAETLTGQSAFFGIAGFKIGFNFLYQTFFIFFQDQHDYILSPASSTQNILEFSGKLKFPDNSSITFIPPKPINQGSPGFLK
jgi:hypothetical protein